jgi:hypothetical protein
MNGGSNSVATAQVNAATVCSSTPATGGGCPACSAPDGGLCRDQWYSSALRCSSDSQCGGAPNTCQSGFCVRKDVDGDGIDDDFEKELAELNFPTLYLAKGEQCGSPHGVIYHVRRHPQNPSRFAITYIVLYGVDCGTLNGHLGDAESFAITVDPNAQPGAPATVGVESWAHAGTTCGSTSSCDAAAGSSGCGEQPSSSSTEVVIWSSANKHANYLSRDTCSENCLDSCSPGERVTGPFLNVGEPDHPMVTDLTTQGFVDASGWGPQLLHFNPWGTTEFAGGGRLDVPLVNNIPPPGK